MNTTSTQNAAPTNDSARTDVDPLVRLIPIVVALMAVALCGEASLIIWAFIVHGAFS